MNKELFQSMQKQMNPSPEVQAELNEKLTRPAKKRAVPWKKYTALAACAALAIVAVGAARYPSWEDILRNFHPSIIETKLHSYVTVEDVDVYTTENGTVYDLGLGYDNENANAVEILPDPNTNTGGLPGGAYVGDIPVQEGAEDYQLLMAHINGTYPDPNTNTGDLPGGAYIGDVPVQEGAEDYQLLMAHFNGTYPDWYGGAYLDGSGRLVVQLVGDKDPGDKSLELQVLDWTGSDSVMFSSCKYSLNQLKELMDRLNALPDADLKCRDVMAGWGVDEEANRIELTLTQVNDHILSVLAELDPEDDMILVQVGQRVTLTTAEGEDPAVYHVIPGGATVPDDEDLIADEPVYDGAHYDVENLPEELPQQKQPATVVDSVPEWDASTSSYNPDAK